MKTGIGLMVSCFIFFLGYITFPKQERVYKEVVWRPINNITIPKNKALNELSRCQGKIENYKNKIENNLLEVEQKLDTINTDTLQ